MTPQSTFMITAEILADREVALESLLASMNEAPGIADPRNPLVPFHQFRQLHVARFTVLYANTNDDLRQHGEEPEAWPPTLAFIGDIDGDSELFLAELCLRAGEGLRQIFSHCHGFDAQPDKLLQWLLDHNTRPTANYVNWQGRTVAQVHEEAALAAFVRARLPELGDDVDSRRLHRRLRELVQEEVAALRLRITPPAATPVAWRIRNLAHLVGVPLASLLLLPPFLLVAPFYFHRLRHLEKTDPENLQRPDPEHIMRLTEVEDLDVTNHFNVFGQVKPGRLRAVTIRVLLLLLDYSSRHIYKRGYLTRIQTIHFARWVLMADGTRVFFASNYDGSADSYMDDFINKVAWGLNLVFSNGVGYPRTRWLIKGGAEYEEKYKYTLRRNQLPSSSWYKAYPGLTAVDLARNHHIREGLEIERPTDTQLRQWVSLL